MLNFYYKKQRHVSTNNISLAPRIFKKVIKVNTKALQYWSFMPRYIILECLQYLDPVTQRIDNVAS